ncbi:MAG: hypothetical protein ABIR68_04180 [Ilumatobacteraceae bacterium]
MWTPRSAMRARRRIAVLRASDQRANRSPTVCVRSGRPTTFAVRSSVVGLPGARWWDLLVGNVLTGVIGRLLRRSRLTVVLAIDDPMWRQWRARLMFAVVAAAVGAGIAAVGLIAGNGAFVGFGLFVLIVGWLLRVRALLQCWVSLEFDPSTGFIRVFRAHPAFDDDARRIFGRAPDRDRH